MRVAYTLEQCWHRVPGGTAVSALEVANVLAARADVDLVGVAGHHPTSPPDPWRPEVPMAHFRRPWSGPVLYEGWLRSRFPPVEAAAGTVQVAHATTIIPCPTKAPLVVTVHDVAFLHEPEHFTRRGVSVFRRSLELVRRRAALVLCSSLATLDDLSAAGITPDRLRHVPLGVRAVPVNSEEIAGVRETYGLPERFVLFVGTLEPRKNLHRLREAMELLDEPLALVVAGATGWGDHGRPGPGPPALGSEADVRFLGFVAQHDLAPLYAAATVFCYPSVREGYGLPVLEAMSQGVPVVTSRGTSTEEVAGGAAVLVDPYDVADIARGIQDALDDAASLGGRSRLRAEANSWSHTADVTLAAYRDVVTS